jgi:hypothetical protein
MWGMGVVHKYDRTPRGPFSRCGQTLVSVGALNAQPFRYAYHWRNVTCEKCRSARSKHHTLTVDDVHEAIAKAAPGADELNEQLGNARLNVDLDLRLR